MTKIISEFHGPKADDNNVALPFLVKTYSCTTSVVETAVCHSPRVPWGTVIQGKRVWGYDPGFLGMSGDPCRSASWAALNVLPRIFALTFRMCIAARSTPLSSARL